MPASQRLAPGYAVRYNRLRTIWCAYKEGIEVAAFPKKHDACKATWDLTGEGNG